MDLKMNNGILEFIKEPTFTGSYAKISVGGFFILFFVYCVIVTPFAISAYIVSSLLGLTSEVRHLASYKEVLYGVLMAPIIEETLFRLIYVFNRRNLYVLLAVSMAMIVYFSVNNNLVKSIIFGSVIILVVFLLLHFDKSREKFYKNFRVFFYLVAGLFAVIHLGNFTGLSFIKMLPGLLLVIPQFVAGIILGYLRVKHGFFYAVAFHTLINLILLLQLLE